MSIAKPAPDATPEEDDAYYRAILQDLVDRGSDIARRIHEATAAAKPEELIQPSSTVAYDRINRAVRRTVALARHIAAENKLKAQAKAQARTNARAQILRGVEDAIHRKRKELDGEALCAELRERLEDPEIEFDFQDRPIPDIIEELCRDLGVAVQGRAFTWKRRTPADIAAMRARAAAPAQRTWPTPTQNAPTQNAPTQSTPTQNAPS